MTRAAAQTISITVGTAGHIDHGKTELVKYLTGCNTDRLPEEQRRGMTVNLGFATCELPDRRRVGIVDVPGHERFIHNMVAGASGIDRVVLVVAADDGVMPQTIEHFHIVRMLGIQAGMVVITKSDLVDEERIAEVEQQVRALTAGSVLASCPVVPFSAKTGAGFDLFHRTFVRMVDQGAGRSASGPFRMHVERSFVLEGMGAIVSGIPSSGRVREGAELELLPAAETKRVKGLQVYGAAASEACAGECVAVRLSDVGRNDVDRGMVLAEPGYFTPTALINAHFQLLSHIGKPVRPRTAVRFHIGTTDVPGHMVLPELKPLRPGEASYVQFQLSRPVVAAPGDFYVVRLLSPATTIGGGRVVGAAARKLRRRGNWADECAEREKAFRTPDKAIRYVLRETGPVTLTRRELARAALLGEDAVPEAVRPLLEKGEAVAMGGDRYASAEALRQVAGEITGILERLHDGQPLSLGFPKKELFRSFGGDRLIADRVLANMTEDGALSRTTAGLRLAARAPALSPRQARTAERLETLFRETAFATPRADELPLRLGMPAHLVRPVFDHLQQAGILVDAGAGVVFHRDVLAAACEKLVAYLEANGDIAPGAFRDLIGATRKYTIPLLEYFDRTGVTVRKGNARVLKQARA